MCSRLIHMHVTWVRLMVLAGAIGTSGCSIALSGGQPPTNGNGPSGADEDAILVRFWNLADDVVDVEFYLTEEELENFPEDLFVDDHRIHGETVLQGQGIGWANQGTINPGESDTLVLECDGDLSLGTTGGTFLDGDTGEELGQGDRIYLRQEDGLFACGAVIDFTYEADGDEFTTTLSLNNP